MFFAVQAKFWGVSGRVFQRDDDDIELSEEQLMVALGGGTDVPDTEPDSGCGEDCTCACGAVAAKGFGFRPPVRVTRTQVAAAKRLVARSEVTGRALRPGVERIANAVRR